MRLPKHDSQVAWAVKHTTADGRLTGWSAWAGNTHISDYNSAREARKAVESAVGRSLRWVKDATGDYLGVV